MEVNTSFYHFSLLFKSIRIFEYSNIWGEYSNIWIYSDIQIFFQEYQIFEYEYSIFGKRIYSNIRIFSPKYSSIRIFELIWIIGGNGKKMYWFPPKIKLNYVNKKIGVHFWANLVKMSTVCMLPWVIKLGNCSQVTITEQ